MSSSQSPREPTMEEILSSIRRIISEENGAVRQPRGAAPVPGAGPAPDGPPQPLPPQPASPQPASPATGVAQPPVAQAGDKPVLELTELVEYETGAATVPMEMQAAEAEDLPAEEPFELTEELPAEPAPEPPAVVEPAREAVPATPPAGERPAAAGPLLAPAAQAAVAGSLGSVAAAVRQQKAEVAPGGPDSPLEPLVLEALRPALKGWLDQNLPAIVERVVREEVRRLARRAEED